ncbi:hypothetical protein BJX65DRAFT_308947 [Aspergillus insuetus]
MAPIEQLEQQTSDVYPALPRGIKKWLFLLVVCSTQLFVQGAFSYILIPLHLVGDTFGQSSNEATRMTWHVGGYSLIVGTFILVAGKLGDLYGSKRILDISIFNRRVAAVLLTTGLGWSSLGVWFYYLFQFIQQFRGVSPLNSAVQFTPGAISGILAALTTPYLMVNISSGWLMAIACASFLVGCLLQSTVPFDQSYWMNTFWSFIISAWGMDISFPASATILSDSVPVKH